MPIRMICNNRPDSGHVPAVYCDVRNQRIVDADQGTAVWPMTTGGDADQTAETIYYAHRGGCDLRLRERVEDDRTMTYSEDLWIFLLRLTNHSFASTPRADRHPIIALTSAHPMAGTDDERDVPW